MSENVPVDPLTLATLREGCTRGGFCTIADETLFSICVELEWLREKLVVAAEMICDGRADGEYSSMFISWSRVAIEQLEQLLPAGMGICVMCKAAGRLPERYVRERADLSGWTDEHSLGLPDVCAECLENATEGDERERRERRP